MVTIGNVREYIDKEYAIYLVSNAMKNELKMNEDDLRVYFSGAPTIKVAEAKRIIEED